jgi:hypothetical protein
VGRNIETRSAIALAVVLAVVACLVWPDHALAENALTGQQFVDMCDTYKTTMRWDPRCRAGLLEALKAGEELQLLCPDAVDRDQVGMGYLPIMHHILRQHPELGQKADWELRLWTLKSFWPCPASTGGAHEK